MALVGADPPKGEGRGHQAADDLEWAAARSDLRLLELRLLRGEPSCCRAGVLRLQHRLLLLRLRPLDGRPDRVLVMPDPMREQIDIG